MNYWVCGKESEIKAVEFCFSGLGIIITQLRNSMVHSLSWENSFSASREIPNILWNLVVDYCVHKQLLFL